MSKTKTQAQVLENLFNSKTRVKVLKFLFRNYPINIGIKELARKIQESSELVRKEIKDLERIDLIKRI